MTEPSFDVEAFCRLTKEEMAGWMDVACREYFSEGGGSASFAPFLLNLRAAESEAQALEGALRGLTARVVERFASAIAIYAQRVRAESGDIWKFIAELSLRLDAADAVRTFERKWNEHFLRRMEQHLPGLLEEVLHLISPISPTHDGAAKPLATLLHRLALSGHIHDSFAGITLLRLCEIDPDGWAAHVGRLRDLTYRQMSRIRRADGWEGMLEFQDNLSEKVLALVGIERFANQLGDLLLGGDVPEGFATDMWLWRALVERCKLIEPHEGGFLALTKYPTAYVPVPKALLTELRLLAGMGELDKGEEDEVLIVGDDVVDDQPLPTKLTSKQLDHVLGNKSAPRAEADTEAQAA